MRQQWLHGHTSVAKCFAVLLCMLAAYVPQCFAQPSGSSSGPGEGDLRMADGESGPGFEYGRLEIFLRGRWGNVCQGGLFTPDSGQVACRQLGYDGGARLEWVQAYTRNFRNVVLGSIAPILISEVDCDGTESRLLDCQANTAANQVCSDDLGPRSDRRGIVLGCSNAIATCDVTPPEEEGSVRLRGGFGTPCDQLHTGFVEVFHRNEWGAVTQALDFVKLNPSPDVVCRQLGFPHGTRLLPGGEPTGPPPPPGDYDYDYITSYMEEAEEVSERVWLDRVECSGPEERLIDCDLRRGVVQRLGSQSSFFIRRAGRLTVACRQFAVQAAREAVTTPGAEEGNLRLVDETAIDNWVQGRLEVFFEGSWAQVCPFAFDAADVHVACRQLGSSAGTVLSKFAARAARRDAKPLVFPEVAISKSGCTGTEARLLDCPNDPRPSNFINQLGFRECFSTNEPGLYLACVSDPISGEEEGALRLRNRQELEGGDVSGVLEIFHAGAWGTICNGRVDPQEVISELDYTPEDYFSGIHPSAGFVACKQLGFSDGDFNDIFPSMADDDRSPPWAAALLCIGNEERLIECPGIVFGDTEGCESTQQLTCTP